MITFILWGFLYGQVIAQHSKSTNQDQNESPYSVKWISQFPEASEQVEGEKNKRGLIDILTGNSDNLSKNRENSSWLSNVLFGKKTIEIVKPMAISAINPNSFWVADQGNGAILQVIDQEVELVRFKNRDTDYFPSVVGSCLLPDGRMSFTDSQLNKVFIYTRDSKDLRVLNDLVSLDRPTGIAYSASSKVLWVVETGAHRVTLLNEKGEVIKRFGQRGSGPGEFNYPTHIWIDSKGIAYVVDALNYRIQMFDLETNFISAFGEIGDGSGYFARPKGVATDSHGHIYVVDALFHTVQIFDRSGNYLYAFGSQGKGKEQFWIPTGIFIDKENYIYVADSYNSRIQIFKLLAGES